MHRDKRRQARTNSRLTIRFKLIVTAILLGVVPVLVLSWLFNRNIRAVLTRDANQALLSVANETAILLDNFIDTNLDAIENESLFPVLATFLEAPTQEMAAPALQTELLELLHALSLRDDAIASYAVLDKDGRNLIDTNPLNIGRDESDYLHFKTLIQNRGLLTSYASPVQFLGPLDLPSLFFSAPIIDVSTDQLIGVIRVRYDASVLQKKVAERNGSAGDGSFGVLFDENNNHLAHGVEPTVNYIPIVPYDDGLTQALRDEMRLPNLSDEQLFPLDLQALDAYLAGPEEATFFEAEDVATDDLVNQVAVARLEKQPWKVAFFQPQVIFLEPVNDQIRLTLIASAGLTLLATLVAIFVGYLLSRPLVRLTETVTRFTEGERSVRSRIATRDEIGVLAANFNKMADRVTSLLASERQRTEELEEINDELRSEQEKSEALLLNVLPKPIAERLKRNEHTIADHFDEVTVLFADIVGFTLISQRISPENLVRFLNRIFSIFDTLAEKHGLEKIKTVGDEYMVVGGLPTPMKNHAHAVADMALDMQQLVENDLPSGIGIRIGIHSGPVVAGVIGKKKFAYDLWGDTVNTASRMESHSVPGSIQVSAEVQAMLAEAYRFESRGEIDIKGKGCMETYFLLGKID